MSNLGAVILAAGASSRMGKFKPLLEVDGTSMVRRVTDMMRAAHATPIVVVTGYQSRQLEDHLAGLGLHFVRNDRYYETQMLDSLLLGLDALPDEVERILFCPADIPLVKEGTVATLLQASGDFICPSHEGKTGHPALISRKLIPLLRDYRGKEGLRGAIDACGIPITTVCVNDMGTTLDGDTKDEYAALLRYRRQETQRPQPLQLDLRICLQAETSFWGTDSAQFLELIQTTGSMLSACQCMHMSYSRGWNMINEMERQLGYPVLVRSQGGNNGGGSELTPLGAQFLHSFRQMQEELIQQSQAIFHRYFPNGRLNGDWNKTEQEAVYAEII